MYAFETYKIKRIMSEKEIPPLGNKEVYPSDDVLVSIIGPNIRIWQKVLANATDNYRNITSEWRYYNDGKQWLFKLQHKKKTVFWAGDRGNAMQVTFYFGNKAEQVIKESSLPDKIKEDFVTAKLFGSLRPITIRLDEFADLKVVFELIRLKTILK